MDALSRLFKQMQGMFLLLALAWLADTRLLLHRESQEGETD